MKKAEDSYFSFNIQMLHNFSKPLDFDIFIKLSNEKYVLLFKKGSVIDAVRLNKYIEKGISSLYAKQEQIELFNKAFEVEEEHEPVDALDVDDVESRLEEFGTEKLKEIGVEKDSIPELVSYLLTRKEDLDAGNPRECTEASLKEYLEMAI